MNNNNENIDLIIKVIIIFAIIIFISANLTKCVVESDMPLWMKIWLLN